MKKSGIIAIAACASICVLGAPAASASADSVKCETTATWHVGYYAEPDPYVERVLDASPVGCENVPVSITILLREGVFTFGTESDVGFYTLRDLDAGVVGSMLFKEADTLEATLTHPAPASWTEVDSAAGSCGTDCYRTDVTLVGGG